MKQDLMHKDVNDVNITPEERRSIWQLWRQNLKDWAWYIRENPDWLDLDIQTAVKRHVIAPLREGWHRLRSLAHQKKRREFPESENRLAQLLLFAWGSMPRMGAGLRERFALRRKHNIRRSGSIRGLLERLHLHPAIFLGTCVTAAAVIVLLSVYTIGTTVRYDGINLGTVGSRRTVDQAVQQLETVTRQTLEDQDYAIDTALLSTQTHVVPRRDLESREEFAENLTDQIGDVTYGYTLYVDGEAVAATTYAGAIDQLLEQMKAGYITENTVDCNFVENVEIKEGYVDSSLISNLGYIAEKLNATKEGAVVYTVKPGDVWSAIAEDNGMTNQQLLTLNPGYDIAVLHAGDQLTISNAVPYLTVVAVERQNYIRDLPYTIHLPGRRQHVPRRHQGAVQGRVRQGGRHRQRDHHQRRGDRPGICGLRDPVPACGRGPGPGHQGPAHLVPHRQLPLALLRRYHLLLRPPPGQRGRRLHLS